MVGLNNPHLPLSICCRVLAAAQSVYPKHLSCGPGHRAPPLLQQVSPQLHAQRSITAAHPPLEQLSVGVTR